MKRGNPKGLQAAAFVSGEWKTVPVHAWKHMEYYKYGCLHSSCHQKVEVSGKFHEPAALFPGNCAASYPFNRSLVGRRAGRRAIDKSKIIHPYWKVVISACNLVGSD